MNPDALYDAIEKLAREVVPPGKDQQEILKEVKRFRLSHPLRPPGKGLLAMVTTAGVEERYTASHQALVHDIAYHYA